MIGTIPIFIKLKNEQKIIAGSLAFAAGVMICVSITDLLPETISILKINYNGFITNLLTFIFLMLGIIIASLINDSLPDKTTNIPLYRVGIISMLAIILHNIPEGIATFISTTKDTSLGLSLTIAIALHNIPEGISIAIPIYYATKSRKKALVHTLISSSSEPFGAIITYLFLLPFITDVILAFLFAIIAGIMIKISLTELLKTSISYKEETITKIFFIVGITFMLVKFFI